MKSKIGSGASEEKLFKMLTEGRTDGRTDDRRKVITIAHPEHSSGELKIHFQDGGQEGHFEFPIRMILALFAQAVILSLMANCYKN